MPAGVLKVERTVSFCVRCTGGRTAKIALWLQREAKFRFLRSRRKVDISSLTKNDNVQKILCLQLFGSCWRGALGGLEFRVQTYQESQDVAVARARSDIHQFSRRSCFLEARKSAMYLRFDLRAENLAVGPY